MKAFLLYTAVVGCRSESDMHHRSYPLLVFAFVTNKEWQKNADHHVGHKTNNGESSCWSQDQHGRIILLVTRPTRAAYYIKSSVIIKVVPFLVFAFVGVCLCWCFHQQTKFMENPIILLVM